MLELILMAVLHRFFLEDMLLLLIHLELTVMYPKFVVTMWYCTLQYLYLIIYFLVQYKVILSKSLYCLYLYINWFDDIIFWSTYRYHHLPWMTKKLKPYQIVMPLIPFAHTLSCISFVPATYYGLIFFSFFLL